MVKTKAEQKQQAQLRKRAKALFLKKHGITISSRKMPCPCKSPNSLTYKACCEKNLIRELESTDSRKVEQHIPNDQHQKAKPRSPMAVDSSAAAFAPNSDRPQHKIDDDYSDDDALSSEESCLRGAGDGPSSGDEQYVLLGARPGQQRAQNAHKMLHSYFYSSSSSAPPPATAPLIGHDARARCAESGLFGFGHIFDTRAETRPDTSSEPVYLNVHQPFALVAVGVQGSGKSHTTNVVLENCLLPARLPGLGGEAGEELVRLQQPMAALVLHYDQSESNVCEATGLVNTEPRLARLLRSLATAGGTEEQKAGEAGEAGELGGIPQSLQALEKVVVLVSPNFYEQRKRFYTTKKGSSRYEVFPLLFKWSRLDAVQLKKLMRINEQDSQLYVSMMLALLRGYQRLGKVPEFEKFCKEVLDNCSSPGQEGPLQQRLDVMRQFIKDAKENEEFLDCQRDLEDLVAGGRLVVADLTDPMLSPQEANGVFQVLLQQFRGKKLECGKLLVCDEAHKYFGQAKGGKGVDGLAASIVETVRLMRHEGIRVVVSTQSPLTMPAELLELASIAVCHKFHSRDWYSHLSAKLPLPDGGFDLVRSLEPGNAMVFARSELDNNQGQAALQQEKEASQGAATRDTLLLRTRPRITSDRGRSRVNRSRRGRREGKGQLAIGEQAPHFPSPIAEEPMGAPERAATGGEAAPAAVHEKEMEAATAQLSRVAISLAPVKGSLPDLELIFEDMLVKALQAQPDERVEGPHVWDVFKVVHGEKVTQEARQWVKTAVGKVGKWVKQRGGRVKYLPPTLGSPSKKGSPDFYSL